MDKSISWLMFKCEKLSLQQILKKFAFIVKHDEKTNVLQIHYINNTYIQPWILAILNDETHESPSIILNKDYDTICYNFENVNKEILEKEHYIPKDLLK